MKILYLYNINNKNNNIMADNKDLKDNLQELVYLLHHNTDDKNNSELTKLASKITDKNVFISHVLHDTKDNTLANSKLIAVLKGLKNNLEFHDLCLDGNRIGNLPKTIEEIDYLFINNKTIHRFMLRTNELNKMETAGNTITLMSMYSSLISSNNISSINGNALVALNLSDNNLTSFSFKIIGGLLVLNTTLKELSLTHNCPDVDGLLVFLLGLKHNKNIRLINLGYLFNVDDTGKNNLINKKQKLKILKTIGKVLRINKTIEVIYFQGNGIDGYDHRTLFEIFSIDGRLVYENYIISK